MRFKKCNLTLLVLFLSLLFLAIEAGAMGSRGPDIKTGPVYNDYQGKGSAKYVFLFIGDGMGLPQVSSTEIYASALKENKYPDAPRSLCFTKFPAQGITTTHDASSFITDSASAGTAIATGNKTLNGVISMDVDKKINYPSIAKKAKEMGMKVGIVSSVSIDHATPAVFYSNVPSRKMMYEIALQLVDSGFDYFGGGGIVDPDGKKSKMENKPGNVFEYAKSKGYKVVTTNEEFNNIQQNTGKVWAITDVIADDQAMLYDMDRSKENLSLADFTKKGIELIDNPKGFFMMVEGGKIDWACHANDAMGAIKDVFAFDDAVKIAVEFANKHPNETLIVVTGDHECGGMTVGFAGTKYNTFFKKLEHQKISYVKFDEILNEFKTNNPSAEFNDILPMINQYFGLTTNGDKSEMDLNEYELKLLKEAFAETMKTKENTSKEESYLLYGGYEPLTVTITHILNRKAGIGWTTYSHTGVPVPTYAMGIGQDIFDGYYDNTDIYKKIASVMKIR
ncbi:MAG: alkaline phosphatase [Desulfobacterales bacterium]|nr:alkaline phosphatase [Desulfobacterales bacterium]